MNKDERLYQIQMLLLGSDIEEEVEEAFRKIQHILQSLHDTQVRIGEKVKVEIR